MTELPRLGDEARLQGLNAHPHIKRRIASLLAAVEDADGDLKKALAAETRLIEEMRANRQWNAYWASDQKQTA